MKKIYLFFVIPLISGVLCAQGPDGNFDVFLSQSDGDWDDPATWSQLIGDDVDGIPDGDDVVLIDDHDINVVVNSGYGRLTVRNASATNTLTVNTGVSLEGFTTGGQNGEALLDARAASVDCKIVVNGTMICSGLELTHTGTARARMQVFSGGELDVNGKIFFDGTNRLRTRLEATSGTGNVIRVSDSITGGSINLNLGNSLTSSTLHFDGTAAQNMPEGADADYSSVSIENSAGVTFDGDISSLKFDGSMNIASGGVLNDGGFDIGVRGNWTSEGTFNPTIGAQVSFEGVSGGQTISGGATHNWARLRLSNSNGLVLNGTNVISDILDIDNGNFDASGATVILDSDATNTGNMDNIGSGSYTGNLTVRRQVTKSTQGWLSLASPVDGTTLTNWNDGGTGAGQEFIFSGITNSDYPSFSFVSAYEYSEAASGATRDNGFQAAADMSDPTGVDNAHHAHYVYADAATFNIEVSGPPNTGDQVISLSYNNAGGAAEDGWNLIGNPFPCTISWDLINNDLPADIEDFYSVYSDDNNNYVSWEGGVGGLNGGTEFIPSSQGFWVQATANTTLTINEADKAATEHPTFVKSSLNDVMRINFEGTVNSYKDEALIVARSSYNNTAEFGDRAKFFTQDTLNAPTLSSFSTDGGEFCINKINNGSPVSIPLKAISGRSATGTYELSFDIPSTFFSNACITLEDLHTGAIQDLRQLSDYSFVTSDTTTLPRFMIHFAPNLNVSHVDNTCNGDLNGEITISANSFSGSNVYLLNNSGDTIASSMASSNSITFDGLASGIYNVSTDFVGACGVVSDFQVSINNVSAVSADFEFVQSTIELGSGEVMEVVNHSVGNSYLWDFGDGAVSTLQNPSHEYTAAGNYDVALQVQTDLGCNESIIKSINVVDGVTSVAEEVNLFSFNVNEDALTILSKESLNIDLIDIYDIAGKKVSSVRNGNSSGNVIQISINGLASGTYVINLQNDKDTYSLKVVL